MNSDTIRDLCTAFRLGTLHAVEPLGGTRNANYLVTTSSGKWFVRRRYEGYCDPARIAFDHQVLRHLGNRRAPVPVPLQATDGQTWRRDADRAWEVHPFVEGAHLREGRAEDLEALGSGLALFHEAGVDFPGRFDKLSPRGETDPRVIEGQANRIVADDPGCAAALERYREWTASAGDDVPDPLYAALHHTIVHGDVQPANILINEGRVAAFVDLDWCGWRPRIYDLAYALLLHHPRDAHPRRRYPVAHPAIPHRAAALTGLPGGIPAPRVAA